MKNDSGPSGVAHHLLTHPMLVEILDRLERDAIEAAIDTDDFERRDQKVRDVRAIRNLRLELMTLAEGKTNQAQARAVA